VRASGPGGTFCQLRTILRSFYNHAGIKYEKSEDIKLRKTARKPKDLESEIFRDEDGNIIPTIKMGNGRHYLPGVKLLVDKNSGITGEVDTRKPYLVATCRVGVCDLHWVIRQALEAKGWEVTGETKGLSIQIFGLPPEKDGRYDTD